MIKKFVLLMICVSLFQSLAYGQNPPIQWTLNFSEPDGVWVHETSVVACAAYCFREQIVDGVESEVPFPPNVNIPVAVGLGMAVITPGGGTVNTIVYEGSGTLINQGAASPGHLAGTVSPTTKWRLGESYDIYPVAPNYTPQGKRTFNVGAVNQDQLDKLLQFLNALGGIF